MSKLGNDLLNFVISSVQEDFEDLADELKDLMVEEAHKKTGNLSKSIITEKMSDTQIFVGTDGDKVKRGSKNNFDYSKAYWKGHKEIKPKNKKTLRFEVDGKVVYAKKVRATDGDPFVERAIGRFNK